jgi:hypothetical protein
MKTCTKCQESKPLDQFYKRADRDAYHSWCKSCKHEAGKKWHSKNKERHAELTSQWYEQNKEKHLKNSKNWYEANKHRKLQTVTAREQRLKNATPAWVTNADLQVYYAEARRLTDLTGIQFEVDHIIPVTNKKVSGLNVPENLQVIPAYENRRKANKLVGLE